MRLLPLALLTAAVSLPASATPIVLDDYSSDANFVAGKYTHHVVAAETRWMPVSDSVIVEDGKLSIQTRNADDEVKTITSAHMWNDGERLKRVGDSVSIEVSFNKMGYIKSGGLQFNSDITGTLGGTELRIHPWSPTAFSLLSTNRINPRPFITEKVDIDTSGISSEDPLNILIEVEVLDVTPTSLELSASASSDLFPTVSMLFTVPGTESYFGPVAWSNFIDRGNPSQYVVKHDNLTYTPAPEPSSLALLGITGMLLVRRRKLQ